jgi:hypothetical protein
MHYYTQPPAASGPDGTTDSKPEEATRALVRGHHESSGSDYINAVVKEVTS